MNIIHPDDFIYGTTGDDEKFGTEFNDYIYGYEGSDTLRGAGGVDYLSGGIGNDWLYGDAANDQLDGGTEDDYLEGGAGFDSLVGGYGNDLLDGGTGTKFLNFGDTLAGGPGDDIYVLDDALDSIDGASEEDRPGSQGPLPNGSDTIRSYFSNISLTSYPNIEHLQLMGDAQVGTGSEFANQVEGNGNENTLSGAGGNDTLYGYESSDVLHGDAGSDTLHGGGDASRDWLYGDDGDDWLNGQGGNDVIDGGAGADLMYGGDGNDEFTVDSQSDQVVESEGQGEDDQVATATVSFTLGANIEALVLLGGLALDGGGNSLPNRMVGNSAANSLHGEDGSDNLTGNAGADVLDGGAGDDLLVGGADNDVYKVDSLGDEVVEAQDSGVDRIESTVTLELPPNVENLLLLGSELIDGTGNSEDNRLEGNAATNVLDGGIGVDHLIGGGGYDIYYVDQSSDIVIEQSGGGIDTVHATADYALPAFVERLVLEGASNLDGTGNSLPNRITGQPGDNELDGGLGNDSLVGSDGNDQLFGREGDDTLDGGAGNDTLDGGPGLDSMIGGAGDDVFYVDYNTGAGVFDLVVEATSGAAGGHDRILATVSYTLPANVEVLRLKGSDDIEAIGNALPNRIDGNSGDNYIVGGGGDDSMWGGAGIDSMEGGPGDDTYYVDNVGDTPDEAVTPPAMPGPDPQAGGSNTDLVISLVSFTLRANIENLLLDGSKNLNGSGNDLRNLMTGNQGNNALSGKGGADTIGGGLGSDVLDGGAGADLLSGGAGADVYVVDDPADTILAETASADVDTVKAALNWVLDDNLENLTLTGTAQSGTGNTLANTLSGNGGGNLLKGLGNDDLLRGFAGDDTLSGGVGKDTVTGGAGADRFAFDVAVSAANADTITDFLPGTDKIRLDDDFFTQFDSATAATLPAGAFFAAASSGAAHEADDRIIYNASTGALFYDPDGTGAAPGVRFATLTGAPALAAGDFVIVN